ncbi:MAG: hypothetical protein JO086_15205 [Acidimicrobiia bacterium]|nr:hypothetical protein [Acidimicrobiia bacterium]
MSAHAQLGRARTATPSTSAPTQLAPYGSGSGNPQYTLSPVCPANGRPTTGFMCMVVADTITTLVVWKRDPHTLAWGVLASFDVPNNSLATFTWISFCGVNASELWFQTDAAAATHTTLGPLVLVEETSGG